MALPQFDLTGVPATERGPWMQTWTGRKFYLLDPQPEDIDPVDIARGLSFQSRFTGQCSEFYSIAQHSVMAAGMAADKCDEPLARIMLMHDATEAYLGDVNRPLKSLLPEYQRIERGVWRAIALRFGLPAELPPEVKKIDNDMLALEKKWLLPNSGPWPNMPPEPKVGCIAALTPMGSLAIFNTIFRKLFPAG